MKKLTDKVTGFIYEYFRTDNNEIVYRGSSEHKEGYNRTPLENVDFWHREGHTLNSPKFPYKYTVFRSNLRRPLGKKVRVRMLIEPKEMTREEMLILEGDMIQERLDKGQCYLNHDPNPLKTWKRFNG
tara:strand:- start:393 stop:776 length:384 start_codon:yes stop_codon:yes gene_type:complete